MIIVVADHKELLQRLLTHCEPPVQVRSSRCPRLTRLCVRMALETAAPIAAGEAVNEIRRQISKGRQFEGVREYIGERWPTLEDAVHTGWSSAVHANARPYKITSLFLEALKAPKRVANPLLSTLEKDLSNA